MKFIFAIAASSLAFGCGVSGLKFNPSTNLKEMDSKKDTNSELALVCASESTSYQSGLQLVNEMCVPKGHSKAMLSTDTESYDLNHSQPISMEPSPYIVSNSASTSSLCKVSDNGADGVKLSESCVTNMINPSTSSSSSSSSSVAKVTVTASNNDCNIEESTSGNATVKASCGEDSVIPSPEMQDQEKMAPMIPEIILVEPDLEEPLSPDASKSSVSVVAKGISDQGSCQITTNIEGNASAHGTCDDGETKEQEIGKDEAMETVVVSKETSDVVTDPSLERKMHKVSKKISCKSTVDGQECTKSKMTKKEKRMHKMAKHKHKHKHIKHHKSLKPRHTTWESQKDRFAKMRAMKGKRSTFNKGGLTCEKVIAQKEHQIFISTICTSM